MSHRTGACPSAPPTLLTHCPWTKEQEQTRCRYLCSVWGLLTPQLRDPGLYLSIHQAVFPSAVAPQLSYRGGFTSPSNVWGVLGPGCPVGDECWCWGQSPSLQGCWSSTCLESAAGTLRPGAPSLLCRIPGGSHSALCNCLRGRRGHSRCLIWSLVSPLLSSPL